MKERIAAPSTEFAGGSGASLPRIANVEPCLRRVPCNSALFRQGTPTFGIFRLVSGRIRLVRITQSGAQVPMHTVRPGQLFAEPSIFSARYHCDAIAMQASEVLVYSKAELTARFREHGNDLWMFAAAMAHHVQALRSDLTIRQIRSAKERVIQSLELRCGAGDRSKLDGTLKQFAEEIGLTHEALYRALAGLEGEGRITRSDDEIRLVRNPVHTSKQR